MVEEVKAMKGAKWNNELKYWTVENCKRIYSLLIYSLEVPSFKILTTSECYESMLHRGDQVPLGSSAGHLSIYHDSSKMSCRCRTENR